ncbi:hypothetical protein FPSE_00217 [Fusarium pseudograminearum CS3096]|uniref:Uncharacterized protein n=1 Tax=Fusarium pseudograminearum (strain CS3096) TaxID=1028729 RepID=K3VUG1_FUSPC|nr:hypothetical protein FPSE_00217 [Fusarium pseudograminearum CS3096]EKJ79532.1 hypothetical protein FPSE_00217 [Fusarium pseudograminearum CS3096]
MSQYTIPDRLFSQAAIQYCGFNQIQAARLWERWEGIQREPDDHPAKVECTFLEILTCFINDSNDVWIGDDTVWIRCMEHWGIATEMQDAIMDQRFKRLRMTRTCVQWIHNTIELRYTGLEHFLQFSSCKALCCDHSSNLGLDQKPQGGIQDTHRKFPSDYSGETLSPAVDVAFPGMTALYKATSEPRVCSRILNPFLDSEGNLERVEALDTPPPSDFSALSSTPYFGTSLQTAHVHAAYLKRRDNRCQEVAVVRLCIPNAAFQSLNSTQIVQAHFPSDDWKKLVWHSKRSLSNKELLRFRRATVVVGSVAGKPGKAFQKLESWKDITEEHVSTIGTYKDGEPDVQYGFISDDGSDFLEAHATDIKVLPYSNEQYLEWMAEHKPE